MAEAKDTQAETRAAADDALVPQAWPGAFGIYHHSRRAVLINLVPLIILWLLDVVGSIFQAIPRIGPLISFIVSLFISVAFIVVLLASAKGEHITPDAAISKSWQFILRFLGLNILVGLSVAGGLILLVIPGLIILPRLALANYYLIDKDMGVMDAYKASWNDTRGHAGKVWGIIGVTFLMILPVITIIGIIATVYLLVMYSAAYALLYLYLQKQPAADKPAEA